MVDEVQRTPEQTKPRPKSAYVIQEQATSESKSKDNRFSPEKEQALFTLDQVIQNAEENMGEKFKTWTNDAV